MPVFGGGGAAEDAADAAEDAAETQAEAIEKGIDTQFKMFKIGRRDLAPYRKQGYAALNMLGQMYGLPPLTQRHITKKWKKWKRAGGEPGGEDGGREGAEGGGQLSSGEQEARLMDYIQHGHGRENQRQIGAFGENIPEEVSHSGPRTGGGGGGGEGPGDEPRKFRQKSMQEYGDPGEMIRQQPGYKFRYEQGLKAVDQGAAAGGRLFSGGQMKEVSRYGQEYASAEFDKVASRLAQIAGLGGGAAGQSANLAYQTGQGVASSQTAVGTARASGYVGSANAQSQPNALNTLLFGPFAS